MNLSFDNHSVSNSPSKAPTPLPFRHLPSGMGGFGVGGEYDSLKELQFRYYHTPQSLRDSSPILGEQLKHNKLFSSNSRFLTSIQTQKWLGD
jgi:hypothetical protein